LNKPVRKVLIFGTLLILGSIMILAPFTFMNDLSVFAFAGIFVGLLGGLVIITSVAYWYYIWPDEFESGKETQEADLAIGINKWSDSPQNRDAENIYQAGMYSGQGSSRAYFGGADLLKPNRPKDR
jgi:hypothetical protein